MNPCSECPFRKKFASGWLGEHETSQEIIDLIRHDQKFPCHVQVNAIKDHLMADADEDDVLTISENQAYRQATREASHCVGALAFMKNTGKLSRDPQIAMLQQQVGKRDDCFNSAEQMRKHHKR